MHLAWFSPLPPSTSGIAAYSAELVPRLARRGHSIDCFTADAARDFVWKHRRRPYDLTVFQLGNAACHDYVWGYLFRYPGMVVLHDAQLHQARALWLTRRWQPRRTDYLAEFRANHPDAPPDVGELVAAGLGGSLYQHWPLLRLVIESARLVVVHNRRLRDDLRTLHPGAAIEAIEMGVADPLTPRAENSDRSGAAATSVSTVRARHAIPHDAILLAAFGGVTPEKRIGPLMRAVSVVAERHPRLHLMLVGSPAGHFDAMDEAKKSGIADRVHVTGYVADTDLADYLRAADLCACLRWPTNRETSASWLRCLAAGRATIVTDLAHLADVPTLDPRGWRLLDSGFPARDAVAVSIDILDEDHSLQLALERLAGDQALRTRLGDAARAWWMTHHQLDGMTEAYQHLLEIAAGRAAPQIDLPPHLTADGSTLVQSLAASAGVADRVARLLRG